MSDSTSIVSPCVNICTINPETGFCFGCYRTVNEITHWSELTAVERLRIIHELDDRQQKEAK